MVLTVPDLFVASGKTSQGTFKAHTPRMQEDELQQARARHARSREKNATLKDNNRILTEQAGQLQDECEALEAAARRREHQLRGEMTLVAQVRAV